MAFMGWVNGTDVGTFEEMAKRGSDLEDELMAAATRQIAFADKGDLQATFVNAADYSDEWAKDFRVWYICQAPWFSANV